MRIGATYQTGLLEFFADQTALAEPAIFKAHLSGSSNYAERPAGPLSDQTGALAGLAQLIDTITVAQSAAHSFPLGALSPLRR